MGGAWVGVRMRGCSRGWADRMLRRQKAYRQTDREAGIQRWPGARRAFLRCLGLPRQKRRPTASAASANGKRGALGEKHPSVARTSAFWQLASPASSRGRRAAAAEQGCDTAARMSYCNCFHILLAVLCEPEKRNKGE